LAARHFYSPVLLCGCAFIVAVIVTLASLAIHQGRADATRTIDTALANLAGTFSLQVNTLIHQTDLGLLAVLDELSRQRKGGRWDDASMAAVLAREQSRHPDVVGFRVFGADGKPWFGGGDGDIDLSRRAEFAELRASPADMVVVTAPFVDPPTRQLMIALARGITNPDGAFGGAVYGVVPVRHLSRSLATLDLGPGGSAALYHTSFVLAARFPEIKVGSSTISDQLRAAIQSGAHTARFSNLSPVDGVQRTGLAQKIDGMPYYISVALADDDYLTEWRHNRDNLILISGLLIGVVGAGTLFLYRTLANLRRTVGALTSSEEKLRGLFELSPVGIALTSLDGRLVEFNEAFRAITGYHSEELHALDTRTLTPGQDQEDEDRQLQTLRSAGRHGPDEREFIRKDGARIPLKVQRMMVVGGDGRQYIWSLVEDISERRRSEALRKAQAQLEAFIHHAPLSIAMFDRDMTYLAASDRWAAGYGCRDTDLVGRDYYQLDPSIPAEWKKIHQRGLAGEPYRREEDSWVHADGGKHWLRWAVQPWIEDSGKVGGIIISTEDVTERKQAETDLRVAATAMESQEGTVICDASGTILRVNQAFSRITGYPPDEAVGQKTNLLKSGRHDPAFYTAMWDSIIGSGTWAGEIWNRRKDGGIYPEWLNIASVKGGDGAVTHYVGTFSDISQRKEAEDQIRRLAFFDALTGLPNRRLLNDRLQQALAARARTDREGALLFVDLDNFKTVNDTQGHETGDLLLREVAWRLTSGFREADTVARLGGDEFVVVLADLSGDPDEAATQAGIAGKKILTTLGEPYALAGNVFRCTPSIGITLFGSQRASVDELMKQADIAMYQAKAAGRNNLRFFDPALQAIIKARATLEAELRHGLKEDQFILYFQPQVGRQGGVRGAEALVRWRHPRRGLVPPAEFIPLAEETGLILGLGRQVLDAGCAQIVAWSERSETAHFTLAVNVSAKQFQQSDFVEQVLDALSRSGADPKKLKLELTESLLVENVPDMVGKMVALKTKGVGFALDDFGTGYSSLSYLKRLPLDELKIDRSFVRDILTDPNDAAIARTIVALGRSLGLGVIAEGVETSEQHDFLAGSGCHAYQGYLFGRPSPIEDFERFARQR
jgi:diguanylate cyclase (GGDEF)-like protein/PAS domain S-box-containing protein